MKEIIDKLQEKRQEELKRIIKGGSNMKESRKIELAKKLLEGEGYVVREKKITESSENFIKLIFNATSKAPSSPEWDGLYNDLNIIPKDSGVACPWDADVSFENKNVVLTGTLTPGGPGSGTMIVKVPFSKFNQFFDIVIELNDGEDIDDFCNRYDWDYHTVDSMF